MNRRNFLAMFLSGVSALVMGFGRAFGQVAAAKVELVSPGDAHAKAMQYVEDAKKTSPKARVDKTAFCNNCFQYQIKSETTQGGKKCGPCNLFPGKYVTSEGWCTSWFKRPA